MINQSRTGPKVYDIAHNEQTAYTGTVTPCSLIQSRWQSPIINDKKKVFTLDSFNSIIWPKGYVVRVKNK